MQLFNFNVQCPARDEEQQRVFQSAEFGFPELGRQSAEFMRSLSEQLGFSTSSGLTYMDAYLLWDYLYMLRAEERPFPGWASEDVYQRLTMINNRLNRGLITTEKELRLRGGPLLDRIGDDLKSLAVNNSTGRLFQGFSAHDHTLAVLLSVLSVEVQMFPEPGSALLLELHRSADQQHFVKVSAEKMAKESKSKFLFFIV